MNDALISSRLMHKFLAFFFKHLYHDLSWAYDLVAGFVSLGRWNKWVAEVIPLLHGNSILELGFGPGHLQAALQNRRITAFGLDESIQMGRMAIHRLSHLSHKQSQRIICARAEAIPYPGSCFETVVATFPTPYIFLPETVSEITRVLRKGGALVILLAAKPTGENLADRFISWLFAITGESPPDQLSKTAVIEPFINAGLITNAAWVKAEHSNLFIVTAIKP